MRAPSTQAGKPPVRIKSNIGRQFKFYFPKHSLFTCNKTQKPSAMRTRFLNTDYFTSSHSPTETLSFLNLPLPQLPPWHLSTFKDELLRFDSFLNVPLETDRLPIDAALSKFLSDTIPQFIDVDFRDLEDTRSPIGNVEARFSEVKR